MLNVICCYTKEVPLGRIISIFKITKENYTRTFGFGAITYNF